VRRLVEDEKVAFLFNTLGTAPNLAIRQYLNDNKIPQLFVSTGASVFSDPAHFPWTIGYNPNYQTEARIYGRHILATKPDGKIAVLYQNDGFGKDYLVGLKEALGDKAGAMIVKEASYETSEPTVDSQIVTLQGSGANIFLIVATPKFAAQAIRKSYDLGWNAVRYLSNVSPSIATVLKPAGLEKSKGLITGGYIMDVNDPHWNDQPSMATWKAFTDKALSATEYGDVNAAYAFGAASTLVQVLKQCGNDLSRENVMRQAANVKAFEAPMLIPGITINSAPDNFSPIRQLQLLAFDGTTWQLMGGVLQG
jgi:branched-chain amino acid transport system substrate-binding protein